MSHSHTKGRKAKAYPGDVTTLKTLLGYDPDTGLMQTRHPYRSSGVVRRGNLQIGIPWSLEASARGARRIEYYRMDHLAWFITAGEWPSGWMERVNGLRNDLRIENLVHCDEHGVRYWFGPAKDGEPRRMHLVEGRDGIFSNGPVTHGVSYGGQIVQRPVILSFKDRMRLALEAEEVDG